MTRIWNAWTKWAFEPQDAVPAAALRISTGLLVAGWAASYVPDAHAFLGRDGLQPRPDQTSFVTGLLERADPTVTLVALSVVGLVLAVGIASRLTSFVAWSLLLAIEAWNPFVLNSGDELLRIMTFMVMLMPSGERWSFDASIRGRAPAPRAPWALRLLQLQVSAVYLFSVWAKIRGQTWNDGTATGIALQIEDLQRVPVPEFLATSITLSAGMTYGALLIETMLIFALWLPRWRWWAMAAGASLHLLLGVTFLLGWFSLVMVSTYFAFVPAERLNRLGAWVSMHTRRITKGRMSA